MTEAEMGVIGSILIDNDSLSQIYSNLRPDMFGSEFCQDAYKQILALYDRGENVTVAGNGKSQVVFGAGVSRIKGMCVINTNISIN